MAHLLGVRKAGLDCLLQLLIDLSGKTRLVIECESCNVMRIDGPQNALRAALWLVKRVEQRARGVLQPREKIYLRTIWPSVCESSRGIRLNERDQFLVHIRLNRVNTQISSSREVQGFQLKVWRRRSVAHVADKCGSGSPDRKQQAKNHE